MIITSTKKKKPNKIDNIQKIIDSAGTTQFKNIYKNLQSEIKDKIITKLLSKLDIQNKQIEEYKQEIISLKNDLVYLLKRIILYKNEGKEIKINTKNNKLFKNISTIIYSTSTFSPNNNNSSSQFQNFNNLNNKIETNNIIPINNNTQNELDIKINNYINSIYKHNFLKNETNVNEYYSLNKKENLYDEIFKKKNNAKNNELYIGTDPCINKKKQLHSNNSKRNISSPLTKRKIESVDENKKNKHFSSSLIKNQNKNSYTKDYKNSGEFEDNLNKSDKIDDNNCEKMKNNNYRNQFLKVEKKSEELNININNQLNNYKIFKNKTQHNGAYSTTSLNGSKKNHNTDLKKKIKRNNHYIPLYRSPFLANKF